MKKAFAILACALLVACTYVPPEAITPVVEACRKQGLEVIVNHEVIKCFRHGRRPE